MWRGALTVSLKVFDSPINQPAVLNVDSRINRPAVFNVDQCSSSSSLLSLQVLEGP